MRRPRALFFLLLSGLQIWNAHPALYIGEQSGFAFDNTLLAIGAENTDAGVRGYTTILGHKLDTTGVLGVSERAGRPNYVGFPSWATIPSVRDLATGRVVHFFFAWTLVAALAVWLVASLLNSHLWRDIILKPLYGNGGAGVFKLDPGDGNLNALHELFSGISREPLIAQKFVPDVTKGDKRIILVDGEPVGAINRVPAEHDSRSNMHVGGRAEKTELTEREREICARIGPSLRERGFILVGIDVIGDYMTEINVTSPTGVREVKRFGGADIAALIWDAVEARRG